METTTNVSKRGKNVVQSECPILGEMGLVDVLDNTDPNANWGTEPNFNLSLSLTPASNPHRATETSTLHGGNKKDDKNKGGGKPGAKGAVTTETGKSANTLTTPVMSPGERDDPSRQKSKIPALARSPTTEALVNSRGEQRLKSPNPKHTPTLSPKTHTHSNMAASPKPHRVEQTTIASSPRTTDRVKTQVLRGESASVSSPKPHGALTTKTTNKIAVGQKMQTNRKEDGGKEIIDETQSPKMLHLPVSPRVRNQKGDLNVISPKLASRTPTMTAKNQKPDPTSMKSNEQNRHDSRTHSSETPPAGPKSQNQGAEMALLSTKTPQPSSVNYKTSTQKKPSGTRNGNASGFKETLDSKDSSVGSGYKTSSKASPNFKTAMGSKDTLDSKSGSSSKNSFGSKDSLDSKTGTNSKASPSPKSGTGSRDSLDSKTATEIKASKTNPDFKTVAGSKSGMGSKDDLDIKTQTPPDSNTSFNLKTSPSFKVGSELNLGSNSDILSSSKSGPTCSTSKPYLVASGSKKDSVSPSSSRTGLSGSKDDNLEAASASAKPSLDPKAGSDSSKPEPVRSSSKLALADLSPSLTLSPRPGSASRSPGSGPGKSLGCSPAGPNREFLRSPGSAPGNYSQSNQ